MNSVTTADLQNVLNAYPFLAGIPHPLLVTIDLTVLHIPSPGQHLLLKKLASHLNQNVVVYRKGAEASGVHLCRTLRPAALSEDQLATLHDVERSLGDELVIVAYDSPLVLSDATYY